MVNEKILIAVGVGAASYFGYKALSGGADTEEEAEFAVGGQANTFAGQMQPAGDTIYNIKIDSPEVASDVFGASILDTGSGSGSGSSTKKEIKTSNSPYISDAAEAAAKSPTVSLSGAGQVPISLNKSTGKFSYGAFALASPTKKEETSKSVSKNIFNMGAN